MVILFLNKHYWRSETARQSENRDSLAQLMALANDLATFASSTWFVWESVIGFECQSPGFEWKSFFSASLTLSHLPKNWVGHSTYALAGATRSELGRGEVKNVRENKVAVHEKRQCAVRPVTIPENDRLQL